MATVPRSVWRNPVHFAAFGFGSGAVPLAPGTSGTLAAALIYLGLQYLPPLLYLLFVLLALALGIALCGRTARDVGVHDHSGIVWDEFVGYWITMVLAPPGWWPMLAGFILFRLFDVIKPWPIGWLDRHVDGGAGIMIDDVLAGIMAWLCLQLLLVLMV